MLDPNLPWLAQGFKKFEREDFIHNDVRNQNCYVGSIPKELQTSLHQSQQKRRVKSATQRRPTTPPVKLFGRPKSAQPRQTQWHHTVKIVSHNHRPESRQSMQTPARHRRSQSVCLGSQSSDPEYLKDSPIYRKYYKELDRLESMDQNDCSYCPVDCRPMYSSSFRPTSSTGLTATLLPSHFERYVFWTRPRTAPPTRREYLQLPRHNNIHRGNVPHYTNFVRGMNLLQRDSTTSPPPLPRRAFEETSSTREIRKTRVSKKATGDDVSRKKECSEDEIDHKVDIDIDELVKIDEDVSQECSMEPDLWKETQTEPHAPTPTPHGSPPPEFSPSPIPGSPPLQKLPTLPPSREPSPPPSPEPSHDLSPQEPSEESSPQEPSPQEPSPQEPSPLPRQHTPPLPEIEPTLPPHKNENEVQIHESSIQDSEEDLNSPDVVESVLIDVTLEDEEEEKDGDETSKEPINDVPEVEESKFEIPTIDEPLTNTNETSENVQEVTNQTEEDCNDPKKTLGPPPKYKVDIMGLDSQSVKDLLDIEMRLRRRNADAPTDVTDISGTADNMNIKKPKMQSWLRGRLALSRQSSRFEIPMDVRVLESMTPMEYLVGYCKINKRRRAMYCKAFSKVDRDNDGVINFKEMEKALSDIFVGTIEAEQIQRLLGMLQADRSIKLRSKMFCAICALTERLLFQQFTTDDAELLNYQKERVEDADFSALDWKLEGCNIQPQLRRLLYQL